MSDTLAELLKRNTAEVSKEIELLQGHLEKISDKIEKEDDIGLIMKYKQEQREIQDLINKLRYDAQPDESIQKEFDILGSLK